MTLYDISMRLHPGMLGWPSGGSPEQSWEERLDRGQVSNASSWRLSSHAGTHVDAPAHFIQGGALLSEVPLDLFVGPCTVVEVADEFERIHCGVVESLALARPDARGAKPDLARLIFKTSNSRRRIGRNAFDPSFVAFMPDAAKALVGLGVRLLGIDYLSVDLFGNDSYPAHRALLGAGVAILECLDLRAVAPGRYQLACLPLRLEGSEAAPARAILWTN